jgi:arylsulfatase A-like enzyme
VERDLETRHDKGLLSIAATFFAATWLCGLVVALSEWAIYGTDGGAGLFSLVAMGSAISAGAGLLLSLPAALLMRLVRPLIDRQVIQHIPSGPYWALFLWLFFMAFVPYPLFALLGRTAGTITDADLLVRFTSSAAILVVAAAIALSIVVSAFSFALLRLAGLLTLRPSFPLFWVFAFPLPWLLIPFAVLVVDPDLLAPAARILLPALWLGGIPLAAHFLLKLSGRWLAAVAAPTLVVALLLPLLSAAGWGFSSKAIGAAPYASRIFKILKNAADIDGDGYAALFEDMDCDESDPTVNRLAYDIPGNNLDEDCDGEDARAVAGLVLGDPRPFPLPGAQHYNIIFIMIDALRADHLHFMGYKRKTSPNLDRLAESSLVFTNAISQYPSTGISVPSMLSGVYPEYMRWGKPRKWNEYRLLPENQLITDVLRKEGYQTHAFVSAWIDKNITGLADHFDSLEPLYPHKEWKKWVRDSTRLTVHNAIQYFEKHDGSKPFFLFLHLEDPHEPYVTHDVPGKSFGKKKVDRYDSDIHWVDTWLGFLLGYLEMKPWFENTVIVVVADHGEEFKEHGKGFHGHQIYQESIWVPLILKVPGMEPQEVESRVALVDLFPTLLDITGIDHPREQLQGVSLLRTAALPGRGEDRPVFSMLADRERKPTYRCKAILSGNHKLIRDLTNGVEEFYDLSADPGEKDDLAAHFLPEHEKLRRILRSFLKDSHPSWKMY